MTKFKIPKTLAEQIADLEDPAPRGANLLNTPDLSRVNNQG